MQKDRNDAIELILRPRPGGKIGLFNGKAEPGFARRVASAFDANGRQVYSVYSETLLGQPQAVASIAIAGNEHACARSQPMDLRSQIAVGSLAIHGFGLAEAFVPHRSGIGSGFHKQFASLVEDITPARCSEIWPLCEDERADWRGPGKLQFSEQALRYGIQFREPDSAAVIRKWSVTTTAPTRILLDRQDF